MCNKLITVMFLTIMLFTVTGCTTTLGTAIDTWVGSPISDFALVAGKAPTGKIDLGEGREMYTWDVSCKITFITKNRIIQSWDSNNCARIQPVPGKWKRETR